MKRERESGKEREREKECVKKQRARERGGGGRERSTGARDLKTLDEAGTLMCVCVEVHACVRHYSHACQGTFACV